MAGGDLIPKLERSPLAVPDQMLPGLPGSTSKFYTRWSRGYRGHVSGGTKFQWKPTNASGVMIDWCAILFGSALEVPGIVSRTPEKAATV